MQGCFLMAITSAKGILLINNDQKSLEWSHQETVTLWDGTTITFFSHNKRIHCRLYLKVSKELTREGANRQKINNPNTSPCDTLLKLCFRDLSERTLWFGSSRLENKVPQEIPSSEAALPTGTCVFSRAEQQKKLLLADCPETACKQLDSKVLLKDKKKEVGKSCFLPALLSYCCIVVQCKQSWVI